MKIHFGMIMYQGSIYHMPPMPFHILWENSRWINGDKVLDKQLMSAHMRYVSHEDLRTVFKTCLIIWTGAQERPSEVTYRTSRALLKILQIMINVTKKLSPEVKNPTNNKAGTHFLFCQLNRMGVLCFFVNLLHNNACYMHHGMTVSYFPSLQHFSLWSVIKFHVAKNHPSLCF